jgi:hypothetical protein
MGAAEKLVTDVATDDPGPKTEAARGLPEESHQLLIA